MKKDSWKVLVLFTVGMALFAGGFFLGRSSGATVIYETALVQQQSQPAAEPAAQPEAEEPALPETQHEQININTADQAQLETLPGIGPVIAQRIVEYRQTYGPFRTIDEIKDVSGIGAGIFTKIESRITVEGNP